MRKNPERDALTEEVRGLRKQVAELEIQIEALRQETAHTGDLNALKRQINDLEISKAKLVEDNDRKIRETTHKVGLLKQTQEHEVANAKRETELEVREGNLKAKEDQFKTALEFQREHFDRIDEILTKVLERLPNIEASLSVERTDSSAPARRGRKSADED